MGQKYRVVGRFPIARPGKPDAMPADPTAGRKEGGVFDVDELDPRTHVDALVKARLIEAIEDAPTEPPSDTPPAGGTSRRNR